MNKRVDRWEEGIIQLAWYNEYPNKSNEGKEKNGKKPFLRLYPTIKYGPANDGRLRKYMGWSQGVWGGVHHLPVVPRDTEHLADLRPLTLTDGPRRPLARRA